MRKRTALFMCVLVLAALASSIAGAHQTYNPDTSPTAPKCGPTPPNNSLGTPQVTAIGPLYLDVRYVNEKGYLWSIWGYQETNNHAGMQTLAGSHAATDPIFILALEEHNDEVCTNGTSGWGHSLPRPDQLLY